MNANHETANTRETTESTMAVEPGITHIAQDKEVTMTSTETGTAQAGKKKRNAMKNVSEKICRLRELARDGRSREQICAELGIDTKGFDYLRRKLNDIDRTFYDISHEAADRNGKVGKAGILISADRLLAMGAATIFPQGTAISVRLNGERIVIERAGAKISRPDHSEKGAEGEQADDMTFFNFESTPDSEVA